jgi:hypothetical protein
MSEELIFSGEHGKAMFVGGETWVRSNRFERLAAELAEALYAERAARDSNLQAIIDWLATDKPPELAFTSGPQRRIADEIVMLRAAREAAEHRANELGAIFDQHFKELESLRSQLATVTAERDEAREHAGVLDEQFKCLAAKVQTIHDMLDQRRVLAADGTHPQIVERVGIALKRMRYAETSILDAQEVLASHDAAKDVDDWIDRIERICVEHKEQQSSLAAAQQRVERLREAIRALLALHVTNGPLEVIEYGPGGTTEEEVAHRQIIEAIHQATLTTEATNES